MSNFDLYFDSVLANGTLAALSTQNESLSSALKSLPKCLEQLASGWGDAQGDFAGVKSRFENCLQHYNQLVDLNTSICNFINDYTAHIEQISNNVRGGE